nr:uncharacterized protein LOC107438028 [Parasteatoda tepidariorum]
MFIFLNKEFFAFFGILSCAHNLWINQACPDALGPLHRCVSVTSCMPSFKDLNTTPRCGPEKQGLCCPVIHPHSPPRCGIRMSPIISPNILTRKKKEEPGERNSSKETFQKRKKRSKNGDRTKKPIINKIVKNREYFTPKIIEERKDINLISESNVNNFSNLEAGNDLSGRPLVNTRESDYDNMPRNGSHRISNKSIGVITFSNEVNSKMHLRDTQKEDENTVSLGGKYGSPGNHATVVSQNGTKIGNRHFKLEANCNDYISSTKQYEQSRLATTEPDEFILTNETITTEETKKEKRVFNRLKNNSQLNEDDVKIITAIKTVTSNSKDAKNYERPIGFIASESFRNNLNRIQFETENFSKFLYEKNIENKTQKTTSSKNKKLQFQNINLTDDIKKLSRIRRELQQEAFTAISTKSEEGAKDSAISVAQTHSPVSGGYIRLTSDGPKFTSTPTISNKKHYTARVDILEKNSQNASKSETKNKKKGVNKMMRSHSKREKSSGNSYKTMATIPMIELNNNTEFLSQNTKSSQLVDRKAEIYTISSENGQDVSENIKLNSSEAQLLDISGTARVSDESLEENEKLLGPNYKVMAQTSIPLDTLPELFNETDFLSENIKFNHSTNLNLKNEVYKISSENDHDDSENITLKSSEVLLLDISGTTRVNDESLEEDMDDKFRNAANSDSKSKQNNKQSHSNYEKPLGSNYKIVAQTSIPLDTLQESFNETEILSENMKFNHSTNLNLKNESSEISSENSHDDSENTKLKSSEALSLDISDKARVNDESLETDMDDKFRNAANSDSKSKQNNKQSHSNYEDQLGSNYKIVAQTSIPLDTLPESFNETEILSENMKFNHSTNLNLKNESSEISSENSHDDSENTKLKSSEAPSLDIFTKARVNDESSEDMDYIVYDQKFFKSDNKTKNDTDQNLFQITQFESEDFKPRNNESIASIFEVTGIPVQFRKHQINDKKADDISSLLLTRTRPRNKETSSEVENHHLDETMVPSTPLQNDTIKETPTVLETTTEVPTLTHTTDSITVPHLNTGDTKTATVASSEEELKQRMHADNTPKAGLETAEQQAGLKTGPFLTKSFSSGKENLTRLDTTDAEAKFENDTDVSFPNNTLDMMMEIITTQKQKNFKFEDKFMNIPPDPEETVVASGMKKLYRKRLFRKGKYVISHLGQEAKVLRAQKAHTLTNETLEQEKDTEMNSHTFKPNRFRSYRTKNLNLNNDFFPNYCPCNADQGSSTYNTILNPYYSPRLGQSSFIQDDLSDYRRAEFHTDTLHSNHKRIPNSFHLEGINYLPHGIHHHNYIPEKNRNCICPKLIPNSYLMNRNSQFDREFESGNRYTDIHQPNALKSYRSGGRSFIPDHNSETLSSAQGIIPNNRKIPDSLQLERLGNYNIEMSNEIRHRLVKNLNASNNFHQPNGNESLEKYEIQQNTVEIRNENAEDVNMFDYRLLADITTFEGKINGSLQAQTEDDDESKPIRESSPEFTIGGRLETISWPWMVGIYTYPSMRFICGGTLIDYEHVLSAAHCFYQEEDGELEKYAVIIGKLDRVKKHIPLENFFRVEKVYVHQKFTPECFCHDIALLRLNMILGPEHVPICLPHRDTAGPGENGTVLGWGDTMYSKSEDSSTQRLQRLDDVILYPGNECRNIISRIAGKPLPKDFGDYYLCAGVPDGSKDACVGDSGGPLMHEDYDGIWSLIGVVSFGYKCGNPGTPGTYARVSYFIPWIMYHIEHKP